MEYNVKVGERLRVIRLQRGLALQDVHRDTAGEFKSAVLGAYERGERSLSLARLKRLALHYKVPVSQLLPEEDVYDLVPRQEGAVTIDLERIDVLEGELGEVLDRFLLRIQVQRQDFNGRVMTIRASDVAVLAMMLDVSDKSLNEKLESHRPDL